MPANRYLLPLAIIVVVAGASFYINRMIIDGNIEEGKTKAEERKAIRAQQAAMQLQSNQRDSLEHVLTVMQTIAQKKPNDSATVVNTANLAFDLGKWDVASTHYSMYLKNVNAADNYVIVDRAYALSELQQVDEAIKELDNVLKRAPEFQNALYYKAVILNKLGKIDEVTALLQKCRKINPDSPFGQAAGRLLQRVQSST